MPTSGQSKYWVALARGADFEDLKRRGFRVFYPVLDDYVFLEALDENKTLTSKSESLRVKFLRDGKGKILEVSGAELDRMRGCTEDNLVPGQDISVVEGFCNGLDGKILGRAGDDLKCEVYGFKRVFSQTLSVTQVVRRGQAVLKGDSDDSNGAG